MEVSFFSMGQPHQPNKKNNFETVDGKKNQIQHFETLRVVMFANVMIRHDTELFNSI